MKTILTKLRCRRGNFTLNGAFILLLVIALIVLGISVLGAMMQGNRLDAAAAELTRYIEIRGQVDASVDGELARLCAASGLEDVEMQVTGSYLGTAQRIQFGEAFTVTLHYTAHFGIGGILDMPVTLTSHAAGRSERYWK